MDGECNEFACEFAIKKPTGVKVFDRYVQKKLDVEQHRGDYALIMAALTYEIPSLRKKSAGNASGVNFSIIGDVARLLG